MKLLIGIILGIIVCSYYPDIGSDFMDIFSKLMDSLPSK